MTLAELQRDQSPGEEEVKGENVLPGEIARKLWGPDQVLLSYSPHPTKCPVETIPRYFMRFESVEFPEGL